ncbi:MAG TPA: c-type cytochrome domain-containing protein [Pirellulales bacterium]
MRTAFNIGAIVTTIVCCAVPTAATADDAGTVIKSIEQSLVTAGKFFRDKNTDEAAAALEEAQASFDALGAMEIPESLRPQVEAIQQRLVAAARAVAKQQAASAKSKTAAKKKAPASKQTTKAKKSGKAKQPMGAAPPPPGFTADVAPILIGRCGNCHIRNAQGGLSMASFAALAKGSRNGPIISPGASQASRLVEVMFTGAMPRGGDPVSPEELMVISLWIDAGARFDGGDPSAPLGQQPPVTPPDALAKGNGPQSAQFVRDLAPVLVAQCTACHSGEKPAGQLRLETFAALLEGGTSGNAVVPNKARDSLLVKRLRGIDGDRMPKDKPPVSSETIARFEAWINAGAKFDGSDAALPLTVAIERAEDKLLAHDELTSKRVARAEKIWAGVAPEGRTKPLQSANFILLGNVSAERLAEVAKLAETERAKIVRLLKLDGAAPLVKGSLILFVLQKSSDYDEFVRIVEQREAPRGTVGHAQSTGSDMYACFVASSGKDEILPALAAEQVAGGFLLSFGSVPAWFAAGAARTIAARVEPKNPLVKKWEAEVQNLPPAEAADSFLSATAFDPETTARCYAFVRGMTQKLPLLQSLVAILDQEQDFDESLTAIYRHDARALLELWLRHKPAGRG